MTYFFDTSVGRFWILITEEPTDGPVRLGVAERDLGRYSSVESAAAAVSEHETGYEEWDGIPNSVETPHSLAFWRQESGLRMRRRR
jgi:hypothetical protein